MTKVLGVMMIFTGAIGGYLLYRREYRIRLKEAEALLSDLAVLRYEICHYRRSLPWILEEKLCNHADSGHLWKVFLQELPQGTANAWVCFTGTLYCPVGEILSPLGQHLAAGEDTLADSINESRERLAEYIVRERQEGQMQARLRAGVLFSTACFFILLLL